MKEKVMELSALLRQDERNLTEYGRERIRKLTIFIKDHAKKH